MATVTLRRKEWTRLGHGGQRRETDYSIWLGNLRLRGFSTHGNMDEGYWGTSAKPNAEAYAKAVADELGVQVLRVKVK